MILIILHLLITVIVCLFIRICYTLYDVDRSLNNFPHVPGLPIFKNYFEFSSSKLLLPNLVKAGQKYGTLVKISLFYCFSALMITDLKMIEFILSTKNILNKSLSYRFLERWLGTGLLTSDGIKWKKTRRIITPAFHYQILEDYVNVFHSTSEILIKKLEEHVGNGAFNIYPYITLYTLDIICETAMGTKVNAQLDSNSQYVKAVSEMENIIIRRSTNPLKMFSMLYVFTRDYRMENYCLKILHGYTDSVIKKRRDHLNIINQQIDNKKDVSSKKSRKAFLDLILQSTIDDRPMTDDEIRQEVDTFMFEGHDTTASGISFILYCLSKHLDIQKKVHNEIVNIFGNDKTISATYQDLQSMRYLEMVIKESLRLYPPVPIFGRETDKDVKYYGGVLRKNVQLGIIAYAVHMDPKNYPNPEVFDPERFSSETQSTRGPYSYLTFSAGHRNCIGQKFAMLEIKSTILHILRRFEILPAENYVPQLESLVVLKSSNGILIKLEERNNSSK